MSKPKFKIGQKVLCNVDIGMMPRTIGFHKVEIARITIETNENKNGSETTIIYTCEIEDKFKTEIDQTIERNFWGKAKKPYKHTFNIGEGNLFLEEEARQIFNEWLRDDD